MSVIDLSEELAPAERERAEARVDLTEAVQLLEWALGVIDMAGDHALAEAGKYARARALVAKHTNPEAPSAGEH